MRERRGRTVALLVSGLGVSVLIAGAAALFQPAFLEWWYRIPVVSTWGDLLAQRPMELGAAGSSQKRLKARVGIEATRCPRWSGAPLLPDGRIRAWGYAHRRSPGTSGRFGDRGRHEC
jgi:hypothetical protein